MCTLVFLRKEDQVYFTAHLIESYFNCYGFVATQSVSCEIRTFVSELKKSN